MDDLIQWSPGITLDDIEKRVILMAFRFYRGNKTTTSYALGISIRTLDNKLERYQVDDEKQKEMAAHERAARESFIARQRGTIITDPKTGSDVYATPPGLHVESAFAAPAEQDMPMPKRKEVQTVLPRQTAQGGNGKGR